MQSKFKAGDKVKVLNSESSPHHHIDQMIGGIFEVKDTDCTEKFNVIVWNANKSDCWYFHEHELELVNPWFPEEVKSKEINKEVNEALFEVENFLLQESWKTGNREYAVQALVLWNIRNKILGE